MKTSAATHGLLLRQSRLQISIKSFVRDADAPLLALVSLPVLPSSAWRVARRLPYTISTLHLQKHGYLSR